MKKASGLLGWVVIGLVLWAGSCAAILPEFSKEELIIQAERIVLGTVQEVHSSWTEDQAQIYTYATLQVEDQYKGSPVEAQLVLQIPGGTVGEITSKVSDTPSLFPGQRVLVHTFTQTNGQTWIYGWEKGVLEVENNGLPVYNMTLNQFRQLVKTTMNH